MTIEKLDALKAWQLVLALLAMGVAAALAAWVLVWVIWTIRPFLAAAAAVGLVVWVLHRLYRRRRSEEWHGSEWIGS